MPREAAIWRRNPEAALEPVQVGPVWSETILFSVASRRMTSKYSLCLRARLSSAASSKCRRGIVFVCLFSYSSIYLYLLQCMEPISTGTFSSQPVPSHYHNVELLRLTLLHRATHRCHNRPVFYTILQFRPPLCRFPAKPVASSD